VLTVHVEVRDRPTARMRFDYTILGEDGEQIATGFTVLAFMDRETRRPCKPPAFLRKLF
jgi:acyl-CoA thioester hydrolase